MTPFRDLSIRDKLIGIVFLITLFSLGAGFTFVVVRDVRAFRKGLADSTVLIARVVGDASVSDLAFRDQKEAQRTLAHLKEIAGAEYAVLYDSRGRLFATWSRPGAPEPPGSPPAAPTEFRGGRLFVSQPVVDQGEPLGTISLCTSTVALDAQIRTHLLTMAAALVVLLGLSVAAALKLQEVISGPILELARVARKISEEPDYSIRVVKQGGEEIGALSDGFNEMLRQIQKREVERDRADRRTREKSHFLANVSHELRTPLNSIIGFSDVLLERLTDRLSPKEMKFLGNINASGQHLLGIINNILDLSKIEAGKMEVHPDSFSFPSLVEEVTALMRGVSSARNITLKVEVPGDLGVVEADPVRVKQILYNLISNAVKFSPEGSAVSLTAEILPSGRSPISEEALQFAVVDQGIGIDPADHEVIFHEFRQVDGSPDRPFEGTGLGLALVKSFVDLHRGRVEVRSARGLGSTFTVTLPVRFRGASPAV